jgi:AraC-like DNA-binding protein
MRLLRKTFDPREAFPFAMTYRDTKSPLAELPDHVHDWYELVYVHTGRGTFLIDRALYDMKAGDLYAIPVNCVHRAVPDQDDPVTSTALFFSPLLFPPAVFPDEFSWLQGFAPKGQSDGHRIVCAKEGRRRIEAAIERIREELEARRQGFRHAVVLELGGILLEAGRARLAGGGGFARTSGGNEFCAPGPSWLREVLREIDERLQMDGAKVGLAVLARCASVSPAHLSREFRRLTGMTLVRYIAAKRIVRAKELLRETDHPVAVVAEQCGFASLPHFHRVFKKETGKTPAQYKRQAGHSPVPV